MAPTYGLPTAMGLAAYLSSDECSERQRNQTDLKMGKIANQTSRHKYVSGNVPSGTCEKMQIRDFDGIGVQEFIV
jgi:hypothetical protein